MWIGVVVDFLKDFNIFSEKVVLVDWSSGGFEETDCMHFTPGIDSSKTFSEGGAGYLQHLYPLWRGSFYLYFILDDYQVIQTDMLFHSNSKGYKTDQYIGPEKDWELSQNVESK